MAPTLPSPDAVFVQASLASTKRPAKHRARGACGMFAAWLATCLSTGCGGHGSPGPVAPGEPIPPPPEVTLGTMDAECDGLITALATYKQCPNLEEEDREDLDDWIERAQQDFAAGKKAKPDANAQHAIAAACHKAVVSVRAANERCLAGPKPKQ